MGTVQSSAEDWCDESASVVGDSVCSGVAFSASASSLSSQPAAAAGRAAALPALSAAGVFLPAAAAAAAAVDIVRQRFPAAASPPPPTAPLHDDANQPKAPGIDGYKWRKYGQKNVKDSKFPRSYYRCTFASCPAKKTIEQARGEAGGVGGEKVSYRHEHNHPKPASRSHAPAVAAPLAGLLGSGSADAERPAGLLGSGSGSADAERPAKMPKI